jgi:hypothetical protein
VKHLKKSVLLLLVLLLGLIGCENPVDGSTEQDEPPTSRTIYAYTSYDTEENLYHYTYRNVAVNSEPTNNDYSTYAITIGSLVEGDVYVVAGENIGSTPQNMSANWNLFTAGTEKVITDNGLVYTVGVSGTVTFRFYGYCPSWGEAKDSAQFKIVKADQTVAGTTVTNGLWLPILAGPWDNTKGLTDFYIPNSRGYDISMTYNIK